MDDRIPNPDHRGEATGDPGRPARRLISRRNALLLGTAGLAGLPLLAAGSTVALLAVTGARIPGTGFVQAADATTARAIRVSSATRGVVIEGNDFTGIDALQPVLDGAVDTVLAGNLGL